jgi:hypothetical protein
MIRVRCPKCGTVRDLVGEARGQVLSCAVCGQQFRLPGGDTGPAAKAPAPAREETEDEAPRSGPVRSAKSEGVLARDDRAVRAEEREREEEEELDRPGPRKTKRRKRKVRRRRSDNAVLDFFYYYTGAMGVFAWSVVALVLFWFFGAILTLLVPQAGLFLVFLGGAAASFANVWLIYIAFKDNPLYGVLCLTTCLFAWVYMFMNLEEGWRPGALIVLGVVMSLSGWMFMAVSLALRGGGAG